MVRTMLLALAALLLCGVMGCTSLRVQPVNSSRYSLDLVCVQVNPEVVISEFPGAIERAFLQRGIATELYQGEAPSHCEYTLTYTARQSWDLVNYMNHAEIRLAKNSRAIASATYHHSGGFGFTKYSSTESKVRRILDELLAGYR